MSKPIVVVLDSPNFDKACNQAYRQALALWEIDESGHSKFKKDRDFSLEVTLESYIHTGGMGGQEVCYTFKSMLK